METLFLDKIFNEDCISGMKNIPDNSVDCVICDLPYSKLHYDWDKMIPVNQLWEQYDRICKPNAAIILFCVEPFTSHLVMSNIKNFRQKLTWLKNRPTNVFNAKKQFMNWTEDILVFYKKQPTFNPQYIDRKKATVKKRKKHQEFHIWGKTGEKDNYVSRYDLHHGYPKTVLNYTEHNGGKFHHPCQKPVDLLRYLIRTYTNPGDVVLDNCIGSGSTAIAAMREKRHYIGYEIEEKYYNMSLERIEDEKNRVVEEEALKSYALF